jgi:hypothetical protein
MSGRYEKELYIRLIVDSEGHPIVRGDNGVVHFDMSTFDPLKHLSIKSLHKWFVHMKSTVDRDEELQSFAQRVHEIVENMDDDDGDDDDVREQVNSLYEEIARSDEQILAAAGEYILHHNEFVLHVHDIKDLFEYLTFENPSLNTIWMADDPDVLEAPLCFEHVGTPGLRDAIGLLVETDTRTGLPMLSHMIGSQVAFTDVQYNEYLRDQNLEGEFLWMTYLFYVRDKLIPLARRSMDMRVPVLSKLVVKSGLFVIKDEEGNVLDLDEDVEMDLEVDSYLEKHGMMTTSTMFGRLSLPMKNMSSRKDFVKQYTAQKNVSKGEAIKKYSKCIANLLK